MIYLEIGIGVVIVIAALVWLGIKAMALTLDLSGIDLSDDDEKRINKSLDF